MNLSLSSIRTLSFTFSVLALAGAIFAYILPEPSFVLSAFIGATLGSFTALSIVFGLVFFLMHLQNPQEKSHQKPLAQAGEVLSIKIQRYGKEPRQGIGYLEDGTMVVVNGGAEFIGETIRGHVLSVKRTAAGRMIFCNAYEEPGEAFALPQTNHPSHSCS